MYSFTEYNKFIHDLDESIIDKGGPLLDLIHAHDDPFGFLAAAMDAQIKGTLNLRRRGVSNARELMALWHRVRKKLENR